MSRIMLVCLFCWIWLSSIPGAFAGNGAWGGGDGLRFLFSDVRSEIAYFVGAIPSDGLSPHLSGPVRQWLEVNRAELAADIRNSQHTWVDEQRKTCGATRLGVPNSAIVLSYVNCREMREFSEIAKLLVHESVHHFQAANSRESEAARESFADQVAEAVLSIRKTFIAEKEKAKLCLPAEAGQQLPPYFRALEGTWKLKESLNSELYDHRDLSALRFSSQPSLLKQMRGLGGCAYGVGNVELHSEERGVLQFPMALVSRDGQLRVLLLKEKEGILSPSGDLLTVMPVKGNRPERDLLFISGDSTADPTSAFQRQL